MKYKTKKILGSLMVVFGLLTAALIFSHKIKDGSAKEWNAAPFILAETVIIGIGISMITEKRSISKL